VLDTFRLKKTTTISSYLIVFSLLIKMLMPVAHASTAVSGEKTGFFAALCTANGVVLIDPKQSNAPTPAHNNTQVNSTTVCPLCLLLEQGLYDSTVLNTDPALAHAQFTAFQALTHSLNVQAFNPKQVPIRAPPVHS